MSAVSMGFAPCEKPERYIQQLVSHWGHKFETSYDAGSGEFPFSDTEHATMAAAEGGIAITLSTAETDRHIHMRGVIERHIDRFAFREAPLSYEWTES